MSNPSPRQREILKLVNQKGEISVDDLRQILDISQATAYREIQELARLGLVAKVAGGIGRLRSSRVNCVQCGRENNPRTAFAIESLDGDTVVACCAHCGLMALTRRENVSSATTTDFLYSRLLNASQAWYVLESSVSLCCQPSTLSFSDPEDARRFALGFGGQVFAFDQAQQKVREKMAFKQVFTL
jgi:DeoR/GlpR family transcriptional regulator of sugar metabolism